MFIPWYILFNSNGADNIAFLPDANSTKQPNVFLVAITSFLLKSSNEKIPFPISNTGNVGFEGFLL